MGAFAAQTLAARNPAAAASRAPRAQQRTSLAHRVDSLAHTHAALHGLQVRVHRREDARVHGQGRVVQKVVLGA